MIFFIVVSFNNNDDCVTDGDVAADEKT